jgi:hypothetical protein
MYINPFLAGVLATIFTEISVMFVASLILIYRRENR